MVSRAYHASRDRSLPILADEMTRGGQLLVFGLVAAATLPVEGKIAGLLNVLMLSAECRLPVMRVTITGAAGDLFPVTFGPLEVVFSKGLGPYHYILGLMGFFLWWFAHLCFGLGRGSITPPGPAMVLMNRRGLNPKRKKKTTKNIGTRTVQASKLFYSKIVCASSLLSFAEASF